MNCKRIITLTTDFGYKDPFAGEMKGVILSINPDATLVDMTHEVAPRAIEEGAFVIGTSCRYFPQGTIHVAVVDPGVGSQRRAIIAEADGNYFVGPDNGIFSYIMSSAKSIKVVQITEEKYMLSAHSPTFQGRDVFAPAAAWLSRGLGVEEFGRTIHDFRVFKIPAPVAEGNRISGSVIYIDRFGNAVTTIRESDLPGLREDIRVEAKGKEIPFLEYYSQAPEHDLSCLVNSSGYLELFVNSGSASTIHNIRKGEPVIVRRSHEKLP